MQKIGRQSDRQQIAVIEPVGGHGGMDYYDFGLCDGLGRAGADVALYTCDETAQPASDHFVCHRPFEDIFGIDPAWVRGVRYLSGVVKSLLVRWSKGGKSVTSICSMWVGCSWRRSVWRDCSCDGWW